MYGSGYAYVSRTFTPPTSSFLFQFFYLQHP